MVVINDRWLFDKVTDELVDISGDFVLSLKPLQSRILEIFTHSPFVVISRKSLLSSGWLAHGFIVCNNSLNQVVYGLRTTMSALPERVPTIKTVPRIGYCFAADVRLANNRERHARANKRTYPDTAAMP
ncbi:winged helix-turn-helix domain-containing protein [Caballeronia zhejiangensis]|uniref:winged helix-turn-helix domain-containing protein n=1 Tax=Caballeronia zhejiangensis TaxID=871203 RepID=UPI003C7A8A25